MPLLNPDVEKRLNEHLKLEFEAEFHYLLTAEVFDNMNFEGTASWFRKQSLEERTHANKILKYLKLCNAKMVLNNIPISIKKWKNHHKAFMDSFLMEKKLWKEFNVTADMCMKNKDFGTYDFITFFIKEQIEEMDNLNSIINKNLRCTDPSSLILLDQELGSR